MVICKKLRVGQWALNHGNVGLILILALDPPPPPQYILARLDGTMIKQRNYYYKGEEIRLAALKTQSAANSCY